MFHPGSLDFPLHLILMPALGGLIVGPLVYYFAREAKGHGVPEVMEALELRGGVIRPRVVLVKALASSVCIGTGGSVGPRRTHRANRVCDRFGGWSGPQITERTDPNPGGMWSCGRSCRNLQCSDCRCDFCP